MVWHELIARLHTPGNVVLVGGGWVGTFLTLLYCWSRGDWSDRLASAVFTACWIGDASVGWVWQMATGDPRPPMISDAVWDVTPAIVFLWLAVRKGNLWFGAAAIFQGLQLAFDAADHVTREPMGTPVPIVLISTVDIMNFAMMAAMVGSAMRGPRQRGAPAQAA